MNGEDTAERIGEQAGVTGKTVKRDAQLAAWLDKLPKTIRDQHLSGRCKLTRREIEWLRARVDNVAKRPSFDKIAESTERGEFKNIRDPRWVPKDVRSVVIRRNLAAWHTGRRG